MAGTGAGHDDAGTTFPVAMVEGICKAVIRQARPADRLAMWEAATASLTAAAEYSPERMPWDPPETVTRIAGQHAADVLRAMINAVRDPGEQTRLAAIGEREADRAEQQLESGAPGPGASSWMPKCAYCGQPCKDRRARYCCPSHRQQAYKKRKRGG